ncbi:MAG: hypothetical protein NVS3B19_19490 [Ginsengibacter sp.]
MDKSEAQFAMLSEKDHLGVFKIPLADFNKDESSEVWIGGKLYDVVKKEIKNDSLYEYVYYDANEQSILNEIKSHFIDDGKSSSNKEGFKKGHSNIQNLYVLEQKNITACAPIALKMTLRQKAIIITSTFLSIDSPPPDTI